MARRRPRPRQAQERSTGRGEILGNPVSSCRKDTASASHQVPDHDRQVDGWTRSVGQSLEGGTMQEEDAGIQGPSWSPVGFWGSVLGTQGPWSDGVRGSPRQPVQTCVHSATASSQQRKMKTPQRTEASCPECRGPSAGVQVLRDLRHLHHLPSCLWDEP